MLTSPTVYVILEIYELRRTSNEVTTTHSGTEVPEY
jgi:hypothetical protein